MCFTISSNHPNKKIARRNITCYKYLKSDLSAPFNFYYYQLKQLNKTTIGETVQLNYINDGFHSYSNKKEVQPYFNPFCREVVVRCTIPKGSEYYYNEYRREYVSNQIIVEEIL